MPTMALTNSLSFRQMKDPSQDFGAVRVLGTLGWIVAGLIVGFLKLEATSAPMRLAAASSVLMALYSLTLPHTPPLGKSTGVTLKGLFPVESISLLKDKSFAVFALASFLICVPLQFYYAFTNPYLNEIGVQNAAGKMTMGQMSELLFMVTLPWFFRRLGVKYTLLVGMLAWVLRYVMFAYGNSGPLVWMLYLGILLHGICYDFFFVTGQIYVDRKAPLALRAAAQGMITFITYGAGMFLGAWLSGKVVDLYAISTPSGVVHAWRSIWLLPAYCSAAVLILFALAFSRTESGITTASAGEPSLASPAVHN
jgi:nucleoside transporter